VEVDAGENLRVGFGAIGLQADVATAHLVSSLFENQDDVECGAAAGSSQDHLHWP